MSDATATFIAEFKRNPAAADPMAKLGVEPMFVAYLFIASKARRIHHGHDGLTLDAARATVEFFKGSFAKRWQSQGRVFHWTPADYENLAGELAGRLADNLKVKLTVAKWLADFRAEILGDPELTNSAPILTNYRVDESPLDTFNRALDYIEHVKYYDEYKNYFPLRLALTNCVRVGEAVLRPNSGS